MTAEVVQAEIEGESREVGEEEQVERALVVAPAAPVQTSVIVGGIAALARMGDAEFEENLKALQVVRERVDRVKKALMRPNVDYGTIHGTDRPALLKPGTETLLRTFGLADSYRLERIYGDGETQPDFATVAHARIHVGDTSGPVIAEGVGEANTWETRYRYRGAAGRLCPKCGKETVIRSKREDLGAWWCGRRDGGCGANFAAGDQSIEGQPDPGKAENPDPHDLANTITKMAKKRALVDGILTATGTSGVFTQDEDSPAHGQGNGRNGSSGSAGGPSGSEPPWAAPDGSAPASGRPGASTAGSNGPEGLQATVSAAPEGIRVVRPDSEMAEKYGVRGVQLPKLEVRTKVGNSNHTALLLGEIADATNVLNLKEGEVVRFIGGTVEKIVWQEGKPPKKEVWGCTDVAVMRDGTWLHAREAQPALPLQDPPGRGPETLPTSAPPSPPSTPTPPAATTASSTPPSSSPAASDTAAPSASSTPPTSSSGASSPATGSASAKAAAPPNDGTPLDRTDEATIAGILLRLTDPIEFGQNGAGKKIGVVRTVHPATSEVVKVAFGDEPPGALEDELGTEAAPEYGVGAEVLVVGFWKREWLIATAIAPAGKPQADDEPPL